MDVTKQSDEKLQAKLEQLAGRIQTVEYSIIMAQEKLNILTEREAEILHELKQRKGGK